MAVESLLLSEDAAVPGGRKDAEWVGENAAPAFIVRSLVCAFQSQVRTDDRSVLPCQPRAMRKRISLENYRSSIESCLLGKKPNDALGNSSIAASGCTSISVQTL